MASALVLYPRAWVEMKTRVRVRSADADGEKYDDVTTGVAPSKVTLTLRPHHQADTCDVTINGSALPFDPRQINGVFLSVYMGAVATTTTSVRDSAHLVFAGYVDEMETSRSAKGPMVSLKARDLSSILRDCKPLPQQATPHYSDTLGQAIRKILTAAVAPPAPGTTVPANAWPTTTKDGDASKAEDVLEIFDTTGNSALTGTALSVAVAQRHATGAVQLKRDCTAWEAIEYVARIVNALVSVELGLLVVRRPSAAFASTGTPARTFYFGDDPSSGNAGDVLETSFDKKFVRNRKGIRVVAINPETRRAMQADYPPDNQLPPKKRPPVGAMRGGGSGTPRPPDREVIQIGDYGIHTQDQLNAVAQRIYLEKATQEIAGTITTRVWDDALFALRNGSRIGLVLDPKLEAELHSTDDRQRQVDYVVQRLGCDASAARALIDASANPAGTSFYVRSISHDWSPKGAQSKVDFINLIEVS